MNLSQINQDSQIHEKFLAHIRIDEKSCWRWQGLLNKKGYGRFNHSSIQVATHRYSYEAYKGQIPEGLQIDHLCRQRDCCNPDHLEAVTPLENSRRGIAGKVNRKHIIKFNASLSIDEKRKRLDHARGFAVAKQKAKNHCKNGHEYTIENTRYGNCKRLNPYRICKTCFRESIRRRAKALKQTGQVVA